MVRSTPAEAADGACTPKCRPVGTPTVTLGAVDCTAPGRYITAEFTIGPPICPCGGSAVVTTSGPVTVTGDARHQGPPTGSVLSGPTRVRLVLDLQPNWRCCAVTNVSVPITWACTDRGGDRCPTSCTLRWSFTVEFADLYRCGGFTVSGPTDLAVNCA